MYTLEDLKSLPETDTNIKHHFSDNAYAKEMSLPAGHVALSHKHSYSHLSCLAKGKCIVTVIKDGKEIAKEYSAPEMILIEAGIEHQIESLEDLTWYCIHGTTEKDVSKIDEVAIATI